MNYGKTCNPLFNSQGIGTMQEEERRELRLKNRCDTIFKLITKTKPMEVILYV